MAVQDGTLPSYQWALLVGIPAGFILLILLYCVRVALHGRYRVDVLSKVTASPWLPRPLMEFGYWLYRGPVQLFMKLGITPDMLTVGSLVLSLAGAVLIAVGHFGSGGWVLLLGFTCDVWDGMLARAQGSGSQRGEFLDSTMDRYCDLIGFCGFCYYYRTQSGPLLLVMAALIGSVLVSYVRAKGETMGVVAEVGYMRRYERAVWLGAGTVLSPLAALYLEPGNPRPLYHLTLVVMFLLALLGNITAVWRIKYVWARLQPSRSPHAR